MTRSILAIWKLLRSRKNVKHEIDTNTAPLRISWHFFLIKCKKGQGPVGGLLKPLIIAGSTLFFFFTPRGSDRPLSHTILTLGQKSNNGFFFFFCKLQFLFMMCSLLVVKELFHTFIFIFIFVLNCILYVYRVVY